MYKHIVNYTLSGEVRIPSNYEDKHLPEIKARTAVIIASRLFYDKQEWKALRPYVASTVYSLGLYSNFKLTVRERKYFVYDLCMAQKPATEYMDSMAKGGFELFVSGKYFVKVMYTIKMGVRMNSNSDLTEKHEIEPNFVWTNSFKQLDDAIKDLDEHYSANAVDAVVAAYIQKSPIVYL